MLRDRACPGVETEPTGGAKRDPIGAGAESASLANAPRNLVNSRTGKTWRSMGVERPAFGIGPVLAPLVRRYTHKRTRDTADHTLMTDNLMAFMHKASALSLDPHPRRYHPTPA